MSQVTFSQQSQSIERLFNAILGQYADRKEILSLHISVVIDTSDKFGLWKTDSGSTLPPESRLSLEERLKGAPELIEELHEILQSLGETLQDVIGIITGVREHRFVFKGTISQVDEKSAELNEFESIPTTTTTTELADLMDIASDTIGSLLKLVRLIRKATSRDRHSRALQSQPEPFLDCFDINYVRERYPKLDQRMNQWLIERLGRAITMRRQFLRYFREHKERLHISSTNAIKMLATEGLSTQQPLTTINAQAPEGRGQGVIQGGLSTNASTFDISRFNKYQSRDNILPFEDVEDVEDVSSSVSVSTSVAVSSENVRLHLPNLEDIKKTSGEEQFFECPLQREWFDHELEHHRRQWTCSLCEAGPFDESHSFRVHLTRKHPEFQFSEEAMEALTVTSQHPVGNISAKECPFCDDWHLHLCESRSRTKRGKSDSGKLPADDVVVPVINFRRHVAIHLEQLALFSIPRGILDPIEPSAESNCAQEPHSSRESLVSAEREFVSAPSMRPSENEPQSVTSKQDLKSSGKEPEMTSEPGTPMNVKGKGTKTTRQMAEQDLEPKVEVPTPKTDPAPPEERVGPSGHGSGHGVGQDRHSGKRATKKGNSVEIFFCVSSKIS
ncbi:hypothetical protein G7054_g3084 [Neopestalotiopsis clavispora]|nr:hypothetical protein G7054_g3084 [Neopestalotiopsis clavispora]